MNIIGWDRGEARHVDQVCGDWSGQLHPTLHPELVNLSSPHRHRARHGCYGRGHGHDHVQGRDEHFTEYIP